MKQKKIVTILLLSVMFLFIAGCGKVSEIRGVIYDAALESKMEAETENETNIKEESAAKVNEESGIESTNDTEQLYEEYSYYVCKKQLYSCASSMFLDIERPEGIEYAPVILVEIPDNSKKEERINEIIVRQRMDMKKGTQHIMLYWIFANKTHFICIPEGLCFPIHGMI